MGIFRTFLMAFGLAVAIFKQVQGQGIPPLISFQDGKLGVNFLGYHAAVGIGGNNGQGGAAGGLHAEAGTPFGQRAAAGLRGSAGQGGHSAGELYAGATAGGNVKAAAGLGGAVVGGEQPIAFGNKYAVAGHPGGVSGVSENGFSNGASKYVESTVVGSKAPARKTVALRVAESEEENVDYSAEVGHQANFAPKAAAPQGGVPQQGYQANVAPQRVVPQQGHQVEIAQAVNQYNHDNRNEVVVIKTKGLRKKGHHVRPHKRVQYIVEQEVPSEVVHETTVYHQKAAVPAFNSFGSAYLNAFLSPGYTQPAPAPVVHKEVVHYAAPALQKRVTYQANSGVDGGTFFQDIFNIPISTLSAVSKFLSNGAQSAGNIHVQKTVSVHSH